MKEQESVEGFSDYKESLLSKLMPAIDELVLVRMKLDQLKARGISNHTILAKTEIEIFNEILSVLKQ